jgi:hypothetical protein
VFSQIQEQEAKVQFFHNLPAALDLFPPAICKLKILPQLLNAFEYGNAGSSVLAPLFKVMIFQLQNSICFCKCYHVLIMYFASATYYVTKTCNYKINYVAFS